MHSIADAMAEGFTCPEPKLFPLGGSSAPNSSDPVAENTTSPSNSLATIVISPRDDSTKPSAVAIDASISVFDKLSAPIAIAGVSQDF